MPLANNADPWQKLRVATEAEVSYSGNLPLGPNFDSFGGWMAYLPHLSLSVRYPLISKAK